MFVKEGAVKKIRQKRQSPFYDQYIATLISEAMKLQMSKEDIITLIERVTIMNAIQVKNITKRYRDVTALDHISFSFEFGKIYGFLGRNGAGKSTAHQYYGKPHFCRQRRNFY